MNQLRRGVLIVVMTTLAVLCLDRYTAQMEQRIGLGMYSPDNYQSFSTKDLLFPYSSFQGQDSGPVLAAASGTATTITSNQIYSGFTSGQAVGWMLRVICSGGTSPGTTCTAAGGNGGYSATITGNTAGVYGTSGPVFTVGAPYYDANGNSVSGLPGTYAANDTFTVTSPSTVASSFGFIGSWQYSGSFTFTGSTTSGSATISSVSSVAGLLAGQSIACTGTGALAATTIAAGGVGSTTVTAVGTASATGAVTCTVQAFQIDTTPADLPTVSGFTAANVIEITVPAGQDVTMTTYLDGTSTPNYNLQGQYQAGITANVVAGTASSLYDSISVYRTGGVSVLSNVQVPLTATGYNFYSTTSASINESATVAGNIVVHHDWQNFGSVAAHILVYGAHLYELSSTNPSVFRDAVIADYTGMDSGGLRFNNIVSSPAGGCSLKSWLAPQSVRPQCNDSDQGGLASGQGEPLGLDDIVVGCATAKPVNPACMFSFPLRLTDPELLGMMSYVNGTPGTTYGGFGGTAIDYAQIRVNLGHTAKWSTVFTQPHSIVFEPGNEPWNYAISGASVYPYGNIFPLITHICQVLQSSPNWNPAIMDCLAPLPQGATDNTANLAAADPSGYVTGVSVSLYGSVVIQNDCTMATAFKDGVTMAWAQAHDTAISTYKSYAGALASGRHIFHYEMGPSSTGLSPCVQSNLTGFAEGEGGGFTEALSIYELLDGFPGTMQRAYHWELNGRSAVLNGLTSAIYGAIPTLIGSTGPSPVYPRPDYWAMKQLNDCAGLGTRLAPSDITSTAATYSPSAENSVPAETNVPYQYAFKFTDGAGNYCYALANSASSAYTFTLASGTTSPTATSGTTSLYWSANITDSNETTNTVGLTASTFSSGTTSYSVPAHGILTLAYSPGPTKFLNRMTYGQPKKTGNVTVW